MTSEGPQCLRVSAARFWAVWVQCVYGLLLLGLCVWAPTARKGWRMNLRIHAGIRYVDSETNSEREPLILLHGLGNSVNFWHLVYPKIKDSRRVVAIDIPGFGASATPDGGFTLEAVATDIARFLKDLQVEGGVVCGHSMGATVALELSVAHQELVAGVVLIDGHLLSALDALRRPGTTLANDPALLMAVSAQFLGGLLPIPQSVARFVTSSALIRKLVFKPFVGSPDQIEPSTLQEALKDAGGRNVARTLCIVPKINLEDLMSQVSVPVSLVWGSNDRLLRPSDHLRASELMNVISRSEIDGVGHWPMLEEPNVLAELLAGYDVREGLPLA